MADTLASARFEWGQGSVSGTASTGEGEVVVSALDMASNVTANLLEGVETARGEKSCSHKL